MKNLALLIVAAMLAMGIAVADEPPHPRGPNIEQLATLLDLDDYQAQELERIMTEHRAAAEAKRDAYRASGERPDRATVEADREQMRESLRAELSTVLTAEQLEKFDALHEMRGNRPPPPPHGRRHGGFEDSGEETG